MWRRWDTPQNFLLAFIDELKPKKSEFWKNEKKKNCLRYHHFTHVYQNPQSGIVPKIRSEINVFLFFLGYYLSVTPPSNTPENQNFEKIKKSSGYVIILNLCNKKHNQMMYVSSDMECERQFFVILGRFLLFYFTVDSET